MSIEQEDAAEKGEQEPTRSPFRLCLRPPRPPLTIAAPSLAVFVELPLAAADGKGNSRYPGQSLPYTWQCRHPGRPSSHFDIAR